MAGQRPDVIQLYSTPTPNGVKVSIVLEELGLDYEPHRIDIGKNESWKPDFLRLNPNGKIPAILDPDGPGGKPLGLFESGAILIYLAEKTGKLLPADPAQRYETMAWVFFQMASIGPMFGQLGFFHKFAGRDSRTSARLSATARNRSACSACWRRASPAGAGSWATTTRSPTSRCSDGCATWSGSTARATLSAGARSGRFSVGRGGAGAAGGAARPEHPGGGGVTS